MIKAGNDNPKLKKEIDVLKQLLASLNLAL